ncbi:TIGR04219 family outer membrane beta-barrel protein [Simiduia sp. 21SJ11W-1]|uniref:TIGR04219 family outer membrane beta-barrel protein n=1 Tax=Simiduia sp. 21SJ11W-1 TaxID=2909669 RepID=UPI0020A21F2D|nr:TIGR04219 family outer membrane beta-barrel protein [Simiduia sp. 21SJ11W-1]UTA49273.1 TIGR04219 family outer membrane beta-barrel protein [Simiduia sp. 21SJ11W-1]
MTYKKPLAALVALSLTSSVALADALGLHIGAGHWQNEPEGTLYDISLNDLNYKQSDNRFFYAAFEHPVPLLPNIRVQYNELSHKGSGAANNIPLSSRTDVSYTDAIGYYELLDNWISLDLGIGLRRYEGDSTVATGDTTLYKDNVDSYLPTIYGDANFDLPFTGFSVGGRFQGGSYDDTEFTEYSARVSYMIDSIPSVGAELGYKKQNLSRVKGLDLDAEYTGPYIAIKGHF